MNRRQKIVISVTGIFIVLLILVGLTYAYFLTRINGNTNDKSISVSTANLSLVYGDGNNVITGDKIEPGTTLDTKTFTVTNNGNVTTDYVVVIEDVSVTNVTTGSTTTFESNDFVYTLTCTNCDNKVENETALPLTESILVANRIDVSVTQEYALTVTYKETGKDQSNDMNKSLEIKVNIANASDINPYSNNTNSLAYNIINNAKDGINGTKLVNVPITKVAKEISSSTNGSLVKVYLNISIDSIDVYGPIGSDVTMCYYAGQCTDGVIKGAPSSCSSVIGQEVYDYESSLKSKVDGCDGEIPYKMAIYETDLSVANDDYGTSYYYRGNVQDNYLEFNNMCWRIVRIEGDGSIKITLAAQKKCSEITSSNTAIIGTGHYGYTLGKVTNSSGQQSTTDIYVADYVNGQTDSTNSMKYKLEEWLTSSGIDTSKLKEDNWCLGNTTDPYNNSGTLLTSTVNDLMYKYTTFNYDTHVRLYGYGQKANATLRCDGKNYKTHKSYIGALTADEVVFAGGKADAQNPNYYLMNNSSSHWWTLSPSCFNVNHGGDTAYGIIYSGMVSYGGQNVSIDYSLRPAVTLASGTVITGGNGTINNPYIVA